jgi:predicted membrane protein
MDEQDVRQDTTRPDRPDRGNPSDCGRGGWGGKSGRGGRIWAGLLLLLIGGVLLLDQMNFPLPDYLFNWHVLLIVIGLWIGLRHGFRGGAWLILMAVGGFFMIQDYYPDTHIARFIWPGVLILAGLLVMLRPHRSRHWHDRWSPEWREEYERNREEFHRKRAQWRFGGPQAFSSQRQNYSSEDWVDSTSIFGGIHKKIMSKNFRGGDITTFMGGTEIDLSQADFTGTVRLDVTQIMGGTKIIVPPHWEVRSEVTALFAGFEDKRQQPTTSNPDKVLIIDGTSIFGGIELKNY